MSAPYGPTHGTYTGYDTWGCRCVRCSAAMRAASARQRERQLVASRANKEARREEARRRLSGAA